MYDITSRESFNQLNDYYIPDLQDRCKNSIKFLVGNKFDSPCRVIDTFEGEDLAKTHNMKFYETSIYDPERTYHMFEDMAREILKNYNFVEERQLRLRSQSIFVEQFTAQEITIKTNNCCSK